MVSYTCEHYSYVLFIYIYYYNQIYCSNIARVLKYHLIIYVINFLGKHIINEQFLLNRLAQSAIDIYISSCIMSRCSQSLTANLVSARHEEIMTKVGSRSKKRAFF